MGYLQIQIYKGQLSARRFVMPKLLLKLLIYSSVNQTLPG